MRQGVLSPFLFGIFIDDLVNKANVGCKMGTSCAAIFLYADDVILLAPSVHALQLLGNFVTVNLRGYQHQKIVMYALWTATQKRFR